MDVEIIPLTGSPLKLTGEQPEEGVAAGRLEHGRSQRLVAVVRKAAAKGKDFSNEFHSFTFQVSRVHASEGLAALYHLTHASKVPGSGRVKFTCTDRGGRVQGRVTLEDAIIVAAAGVWEGHSTTFEYRISGGALK